MYWIKTFDKLIECKRMFNNLYEVKNHLEEVYIETNRKHKEYWHAYYNQLLEDKKLEESECVRLKNKATQYDCRDESGFSSSQILVHIDNSYMDTHPIPFMED